MESLNFKHLYYFYIVAKEGSIKDASDKLFVSQPTISDQIKLLEDFFQTKLFERKHRSLQLTKEGSLALNYAEEFFQKSSELTSRLRHKIKIPKKSLDIGITNLMSQYFIYENFLPLFKQSEITINVIENQKHLLLADLEEDNLDLVLTNSKDAISQSMKAFRLGTYKSYAVAHKKYKKHIKNFPNSLNDIPFFNYTNESILRYEIELFFSKNSLSPKLIGEADDIDLFELVTGNGLAFTIVPESAKNRLCSNKDIIILGEIEDLQSSIWAIIKNSYNGIGLNWIRTFK